MTNSNAEIPVIISTKNISKTFSKRKALDNVSLNIKQGEMVALIGPSGSGKSTFLRTLSGLVNTDKTESSIKIVDTLAQSNGVISKDIRTIRSQIGFVFQQFNLVGRMSLLKNVCTGNLSRIPFWRSIAHHFTDQEKREAIKALQTVGLGDHITQRASTLSGGQQQRAAIARTMVQNANIILADEPIASLDPESARMVMDSLYTMNVENGVSVIVSLHQIHSAFTYCQRIIALRDGKVVFDGKSEDITIDMLKDIYGSKLSEFNLDDIRHIKTNKVTAKPVKEKIN